MRTTNHTVGVVCVRVGVYRDRATMAVSGTLLQTVSPMDLFNLPLYEHHLVIDVRTREEYEAGHIASAVSYPSCPKEDPEDERERTLVKFIQSYVSEYYRPENPSPVVVYGNSQPETTLHAEWLAKKLAKLKTDRKMVALVPPSAADDNEPIVSSEKQFNPFEHFCLTIADHAKEVWLLEGGYDAFQAEYDFLCGQIAFDEMFPLPHQINRFLFLGSRVIPLNRECLNKLGITHMIVSKYQTLDWSELDGVSVLRCSVQETNSQDMISCWEACIRFITEVVSGEQAITSAATDGNTSSDEKMLVGSLLPLTDNQQTLDQAQASQSLVQTQHLGGSKTESTSSGVESINSPRILVMLFGRSRSTSVILAYLIRMHRMSFDEAWSFIQTKCWHLIDKSLVYEEQLRTSWQNAS